MAMNGLHVLGIYTIIIAVLSGILLLGRRTMFRGTIIGYLHDRMVSIPGTIGFFCCLAATGGNQKKAEKRWDDFSSGFTEKRNPVLQLLYYVMVLPAMYIYNTQCVPYFAYPMNVLSSGFCLLGLATFLIACYAPNGVIPNEERVQKAKSSKHQKHQHGRHGSSAIVLEMEKDKDTRFDFDGLLYGQGFCRTCTVPRPARSKHCRLCGHCVRRFDHHCAWLNCDVGEENIRWFHLFLVVHFSLCAYAFATAADLMMFIAYQKKLHTAVFMDLVTEERHAATFTMQTMYMMKQFPAVFGMMFFCLVVSIMLFVFWIQHFKMVLDNVTTNETHKVGDLLDYCQNMFNLEKNWNDEVVRLKAEDEERRAKDPSYKAAPIIPWEKVTREEKEQYLPDVGFGEFAYILELVEEFKGLVSSGLSVKKARKQLGHRLKKTFHRGWARNIMEAFFPTYSLGSSVCPNPVLGKRLVPRPASSGPSTPSGTRSHHHHSHRKKRQ